MSISYNASDFLNRITSNNNNYYTSSYKKNVREEDDAVEKMQEKLESLKKAVRNLHNYSSSDTTNDKLKNYLTELADTYNSMVDKKDSLTNSTLKKQLDKLDTLIDDNAKNLKKLGLKKTDGKLEFDEDAFDDNADQKTINKLFTGTDSFIDKTFKLMRKIDKSASDAQFVTTEKHFYEGVTYSNEDITQAKAYLELLRYGSLANKLNDYVQKDEINTTNSIDLYGVLEALRDGLNETDDGKKVGEMYNKYEASLSRVGFSYDNSLNANKLAYTRNTISDIAYPEYKTAFNNLFGVDNSSDGFLSWLDSYCKDGYDKAIKLSDINSKLKSNSFSIDTYA
jgi:hypothetical protein